MTAKSPVIKFSPFEALLIGEKNKILKRQPAKNAIFITRINHRNKAFDLRDLFDLEKDSGQSIKKKDVIFKVPQRVRDFLNSRKLIGENNNLKKKEDELYFDFEGRKMTIKNENGLKRRGRKPKEKANKIKFKKKLNFNNNSERKPVRKFYSNSKKTMCNNNKVVSRLLIKNLEREECLKNRHLLRGKDGKFISKKEHQNLESEDISEKEKYLADRTVNQFYLKKINRFCDENKIDEKSKLNKIQAQSTVVNSADLERKQRKFDPAASKIPFSDIHKKYYRGKHFRFPKFPDSQKEQSDFDEDKNLLDLIYDNFPRFEFKSDETFDDFSDALRNAGILSPEKTLKMYEKKKSVFFNSEKLAVIFNNHIPYIDIRRLKSSKSIAYSYKNERNTYRSAIDEPCTKKTHLITAKSFDCLFLESAEAKEIFLGNLMKPFWQNSWFGRLPEV